MAKVGAKAFGNIAPQIAPGFVLKPTIPGKLDLGPLNKKQDKATNFKPSDYTAKQAWSNRDGSLLSKMYMQYDEFVKDNADFLNEGSQNYSIDAVQMSNRMKRAIVAVADASTEAENLWKTVIRPTLNSEENEFTDEDTYTLNLFGGLDISTDLSVSPWNEGTVKYDFEKDTWTIDENGEKINLLSSKFFKRPPELTPVDDTDYFNNFVAKKINPPSIIETKIGAKTSADGRFIFDSVVTDTSKSDVKGQIDNAITYSSGKDRKGLMDRMIIGYFEDIIGLSPSEMQTGSEYLFYDKTTGIFTDEGVTPTGPATGQGKQSFKDYVYENLYDEVLSRVDRATRFKRTDAETYGGGFYIDKDLALFADNTYKREALLEGTNFDILPEDLKGYYNLIDPKNPRSIFFAGGQVKSTAKTFDLSTKVYTTGSSEPLDNQDDIKEFRPLRLIELNKNNEGVVEYIVRGSAIVNGTTNNDVYIIISPKKELSNKFAFESLYLGGKMTIEEFFEKNYKQPSQQ